MSASVTTTPTMRVEVLTFPSSSMAVSIAPRGPCRTYLSSTGGSPHEGRSACSARQYVLRRRPLDGTFNSCAGGPASPPRRRRSARAERRSRPTAARAPSVIETPATRRATATRTTTTSLDVLTLAASHAASPSTCSSACPQDGRVACSPRRSGCVLRTTVVLRAPHDGRSACSARRSACVLPTTVGLRAPHDGRLTCSARGTASERIRIGRPSRCPMSTAWAGSDRALADPIERSATASPAVQQAQLPR